MVVFRRKGSALTIWIDGVLKVDTGTLAGEIDSTDDIHIGSNFVPNTYYLGKMGGVWLWNKSLAAGEIAELSDDPWCLIRPPSGIGIWTAATQGGGAPPASIIPLVMNHMRRMRAG